MFERALSATEIVENTISEESRIQRSRQIGEEYPDYVPVFVKYYDCDGIYRNILHKDIPYMKLLFIIRQKRKISPTMGLMSLVEKERNPETGKIQAFQVPTNQTIGQIAENYLHSDGFMYINICVESVFG